MLSSMVNSNLIRPLQYSLKKLTLNGRYLSTVVESEPQQQQQQAFKSNESEELDTLYKYLELQLRAHDPPVLKSYKKFVLQVSDELEIPFVKSEEPWRDIFRKVLLKSPFVHKDARVFYEFRTYYLNMQFKNLTGSTADTFLEYIERNLPEGVHMTVVKTTLAKLPEHLNAKDALANDIKEA